MSIVLKDPSELKKDELVYFGVQAEFSMRVKEVAPYQDILGRACTKVLLENMQGTLTGWQYFEHNHKVRLTSYRYA